MNDSIQTARVKAERMFDQIAFDRERREHNIALVALFDARAALIELGRNGLTLGKIAEIMNRRFRKHYTAVTITSYHVAARKLVDGPKSN